MKSIILSILLSLTTSALWAQPTGHVDVLYIGNSFTFYNQSDQMFAKIAAADGKDVAVDSYFTGGQTLQGFWNESGTPALNKIKSKAWDYLVLEGWGTGDMKDWGVKFMDEYRKVNPKGIVLMYMVDPTTNPYPDLDAMNYLQNDYVGISTERPYARNVPVLWAWRQGYLDDPVDANWRDLNDNWHPGPRRSYITAVSIYSAIFLKSPVGLTNDTGGYPGGISLTTTDATYLQTLAWNALQSYATNINWGTGNQTPRVFISAPSNNPTYWAPAAVTINANASDADGTVSKVEFYDGTTLIGTDTSSPYSSTYNTSVTGLHVITAKATDNSGLSSASGSVTVKIYDAPGSGPNLLTTNPSFDANAGVNYAHGAYGAITGWDLYNLAYHSIGVTGGDAYDGGNKLQLNAGGTAETVAANRASVTAGSGYTLTAALKKVANRDASAASPVQIEIRWFNSSGNFISASNSGDLLGAGTTDWQVKSVTGTAPAGAVTAAAKVYLAPGSTGPADFYADNFVLRANTGGGTTATKAIPGRIEAESYDNQSGIQTEDTSDSGGGSNVGWIDANDWLDYAVTVATAGTYTINYRVASPNSGGSVQLKEGSTVLHTVTVPNTGGWQSWSTVSGTVTLSAGSHTLRISTTTGGFNLNWLEGVAGTASTGNLVLNPSFDAESNTQTPSSWSEWNDVASSYTEPGSGSKSGANHLTHWNSAAYEVSTYQVITGLANGTYTLAAWVMSSGGQPTCQVIAKGYGGSDLSVNVPTATSAWTEVKIANIAVTTGRCEVHLYSYANGGNWAAFDDISLTKSSAAVTALARKASSSLSGAGLDVYPAPAKQRFTVETKGFDNPTMTLYNVKGQVVVNTRLQEAKSQVSVQSLAKGLYIVVVSDGKQRAQKRILVE